MQIFKVLQDQADPKTALREVIDPKRLSSRATLYRFSNVKKHYKIKQIQRHCGARLRVLLSSEPAQVAPMAPRLQRRVATLCFWSILALSVLICTLLFYALIWKAGILIETGNKTIGFFHFCVWNSRVKQLACPQNLSDLPELGVLHPKGVLFASVFAYISLPVYLFVPLTLVFGWFGHSQPTWKMALGLSLISHLSLSMGTGMFLLFTWAVVEISELGCAFQSLIVADTLLLVQLVSALHFLPQIKEEGIHGERV